VLEGGKTGRFCGSREPAPECDSRPTSTHLSYDTWFTSAHWVPSGCVCERRTQPFRCFPTTELFHPPSIKSWRRAGVSCEDCTGTGFGWSLLIIIWLATTHAGSFSPNSLMPMENKPTAKPTQQRELMNFQQSSPVGRTCWLEPRFVSVDI
jgi:hypothetical protein